MPVLRVLLAVVLFALPAADGAELKVVVDGSSETVVLRTAYGPAGGKIVLAGDFQGRSTWTWRRSFDVLGAQASRLPKEQARGRARPGRDPSEGHPRREPQHFLYFFPLPHGHGWLRPTFLDSLGTAPTSSVAEERFSRLGFSKQTHQPISAITSSTRA